MSQCTSCALDTDEDIALDAALLLLSDEEKQRANRFHFVRDRERYIRGRGYLRQIVAGRLGLAAESLELQKNAFDKPFVAGDPVYFNLSHSAGTAVLALCDKQPIGIDIEFIDRKIDFLEIGRTVFTENEMLHIQNAQEKERGQLFFNFWTAKEAYLKMLGVGMSLDPKKVSLEIIDGRPISSSADGYPTAKLTFIDLQHKGAICCISV